MAESWSMIHQACPVFTVEAIVLYGFLSNAIGRRAEEQFDNEEY